MSHGRSYKPKPVRIGDIVKIKDRKMNCIIKSMIRNSKGFLYTLQDISNPNLCFYGINRSQFCFRDREKMRSMSITKQKRPSHIVHRDRGKWLAFFGIKETGNK